MDIKRLMIFAIFLLIIWASIWVLLYLKADEVTKSPCNICAEGMNEEVTFARTGQNIKGETITIIRTYYPNGSVTTERLNISVSNLLTE